jgi:Uma2 family endonuclease
MNPLSRRLTVAEFLRLPDDDGNRYELVDGNLLVTPTPAFAHSMIQRRLARLLDAAAPDHLIADALGSGVQIADSYFQPDILVFRADTEGRTDRYIDPADVLLAVEVLSLSNPGTDRVIKLNKYAEGGIPNYWIVDGRARRLTVYELVAGRSAYIQVAEVDAGTTYKIERPYPIELDPADFCR